MFPMTYLRKLYKPYGLTLNMWAGQTSSHLKNSTCWSTNFECFSLLETVLIHFKNVNTACVVVFEPTGRCLPLLHFALCIIFSAGKAFNEKAGIGHCPSYNTEM